MSPRPPADSLARPFEVAIVGNDAVLASLPSRPMQLAHALLACEFDFVVPVSWGEELLAEQTLRALEARGAAPAVFCACPLQHARLLAAGSELAPYLLTLVPPSVAAARYLRAVQPDVPLRITVLGGCPAADDASIDARILPLDFLRLAAERGIVLGRQPAVFESVIPPDRRRFLSLPGGCPAPRALETRAPERRLVTITEDAFATELAEHLLGREPVLVDVSARLACTCCGGLGGRELHGPVGRDEILRHEPPRATGPVLDHDVALALDVDGTVPFGVRIAPRTPAEREDQLPGAPSMDQLRQRAERLRLAVTPARAVPAPRRPSRASDARAASAASAGSAASSRSDVRAATTGDPPAIAMPVIWPASARPADAPLMDEDAVVEVAIARSSETVPAPPTGVRTPRPAHDELPTRTDAVVDRPTQREEATTASADVAWSTPSHVPTWLDAPPPSPSLEAVAVGSPGMERASEATTAPARRHAVSQVYLTSRAQGHPRMRASGGKVLPRAYIRHATAPSRDDSAEGSDTGSQVAAGDVEVRRAVVIEHVVAAADAPEEETSISLRADDGAAAAVPSVAAPVAVPVAAPVAAPIAPPVATAPPAPPRTDAHRDAGDGPAPVVSGPIGADVLARLRLQQAPPRVVARDVTASDEERDPGSVAVFIAAAVLVVALLVAIGVIFRRAPTAPW